MTTAATTAPLVRGRSTISRLVTRHAWTVGVYVVLLVLVLYWRTIPAQFTSFEVQGLVISALPLCFAAMGQAVVVISGGIDLSIGSLMSVVNVISAKYMLEDAELLTTVSYRESLVIAALLVVFGVAAGAFTGLLITVTRVPDIVVTLAMLFVWAGVALWILEVPGGGIPIEFGNLAIGTTGSEWIPTGLLILLGAYAIVWLPLRWAKPGLALYAIGSDRTAAYLSGISVARTRVFAYALGGGFAALGGLALTATTTIGSPLAGNEFTLNSVAAVVLGGVSLIGGVGGLIGPIAAAFILTLTKTILVLKGVDQNWAQVIQGSLIIGVVMVGGLAIRGRGDR
jgi:ribose transport system permease protein